jgi:hypothetical protein
VRRVVRYVWRVAVVMAAPRVPRVSLPAAVAVLVAVAVIMVVAMLSVGPTPQRASPAAVLSDPDCRCGLQALLVGLTGEERVWSPKAANTSEQAPRGHCVTRALWRMPASIRRADHDAKQRLPTCHLPWVPRRRRRRRQVAP